MNLTLTPDPVAGTVRVAMTGGTGSLVTATRTDANGRATVLRRAGHNTSGGAITFVDHSPARHSLVRYDVATHNGGPVLASGSASVTMPPGPPGPLLSLPVLPHYTVAAAALVELTARAAAGHTAHDVIGRADRIVTLAPARPGTGRLVLRLGDADAGYAAVDLYAQGHVALLRLSAGAGVRDLYHLGDDVELRPAHAGAGGRWWDLSVTYQLVEAPPGPLLTAHGWSFDDVAAGFDSFDDVAAGFPDLGTLTAGP